MKILVVGGGGREHALCWKLSQSPRVDEILCAPGNAGISAVARCVEVAADDVNGLAVLAKREHVDITIVGPEAPLCAGISDVFARHGLRVFGPGAAAAALEGDKAFAKDVMKRHSIPTANHRTFRSLDAALAYVESAVDYPMVVKASGLAAGKGVTICANAEEAERAVRESMEEGRFGAAGATLVIEDFLAGEEVSVMALTDGETILVLESSQDHKRAHDGDEGPNTGGMGAYSPAPVMTPKLQRQVEEQILVPIVHAMKTEKRPLQGVVYAGLMLTKKGPRVLEFNVRFGDPECQVLMMRLKSDLLDLVEGCVERRLDQVEIAWDPRPAVTVVVAQEGYPGPVPSGRSIAGLRPLQGAADLQVFHSGTKREAGRLLASGGRVLTVTALGEDFGAAARRAYEAVDGIVLEGSFCRRDIAHRVL